MAKKPYLVSQPFEIQGKPVRIVAYDWRADDEYADADAEGIVDVYQVTWLDSPDLLAGWVGNIQQFRDGRWRIDYGGEKPSLVYPSPEPAALQVTMDWIAYEKTLTREDYEKLAGMIIPALAMPGAKPPPPPSPKKPKKKRPIPKRKRPKVKPPKKKPPKKKRPKKNPTIGSLLRRALK